MEIKTFAAPSRAEAENAATGWWSQQTGLARISEFAAPINSSERRSAAARWKVTVVFVRTALPDTELDWGVSGAQSPWRRGSTSFTEDRPGGVLAEAWKPRSGSTN